MINVSALKDALPPAPKSLFAPPNVTPLLPPPAKEPEELKVEDNGPDELEKFFEAPN
jgi:hypothetical protein